MPSVESPPPPGPETSPPPEVAAPRWRSPLEKYSQNEEHNQALTDRQRAVDKLLSLPLNKTKEGQALLHSVSIDTHLDLVTREVTGSSEPDLLTKYFPHGKNSRQYKEFLGVMNDLQQEGVPPAVFLKHAEKEQDLNAVKYFKTLSAMTLEKVVPAQGHRSWEKLSAGEKSTVRFAESLNLLADATEINIRLNDPQRREVLTEQLSRDGLGVFKHHYERFKRYSANDDIPPHVKKQLEETRALMLWNYPDLEQKPVKPATPRPSYDPESVLERDPAAAETTITKNAGTIIGPTPPPARPEVSSPITPASETVIDAVFAAAYEDLRELPPEELTAHLEALNRRHAERRDRPTYRQAQETIHRLKEGGSLTPEYRRFLEDAVAQSPVTDPRREAARRNYLEIIENELSYSAAQTGSKLDRATSKITERLFARARVIGGLKGLFSIFRAKADERVGQARQDAILSMRDVANNPTYPEPTRVFLEELADELEAVNLRDLLERQHFARIEAGHQLNILRAQEKVRTRQASRRQTPPRS